MRRIDLTVVAVALDWDAAAALAQGDVSKLGPEEPAALDRAATHADVVALAANMGGRDARTVVVALLARLAGDRSRSAARIAGRHFAGVDSTLIEAALRAIVVA